MLTPNVDHKPSIPSLNSTCQQNRLQSSIVVLAHQCCDGGTTIGLILLDKEEPEKITKQVIKHFATEEKCQNMSSLQQPVFARSGS